MKSFAVLLATFALTLAAKLDLTHIRSNPFGKQLLDTVALQLSTNGAVDRVLALLQELDDSLVREQEEADAEHERYQKECNETLTTYGERLAEANSDYNRAVSDISTYGQLVEETEEQIDSLEKQIADTEEAKERSTRQREYEREAYAQKMIDHDEAIAACDDATTLVLQLKTSGSSFLQQPVYLEISSHVAAIRKAAPGYAGLFKALIQMATKTTANQELVVRLLNLIEKLKQSFINSKQIETTNEEDAENAYQALIIQLDNTLATLNVELGEKQNDLVTYNFRLNEAEALKEDAGQRVETYEKLIEEKEAMCDQEKKAYEEATEARQEERDIVAEVVQIIETRLSDLSEYINSKVDSVEA